MTANFAIYMLCKHVGIGTPLSTKAHEQCERDATEMQMIQRCGLHELELTVKGLAYVNAIRALNEPKAAWSCTT